jgi:hypothetical protein
MAALETDFAGLEWSIARTEETTPVNMTECFT